MTKRTNLLRLGVFAVLCLGGLAAVQYGVAQNAVPQPANPQIQLFQPPGTPNAVPVQPVPNGQIPQGSLPSGFPNQVPNGGLVPVPQGPNGGGFGGPIGGPNGGFPPPGGIPQGKFNGPIPNATAPVAFTSKEGKKGWKVMIPGNRPLATPAVVDGRVFIGGGFGSYEFYCLDAKTGKQNWVYRTGDDGPTAAVVSDGYVAFNTESCEIEIITFEGKQVWKKWLGDPLMSMPAIAAGKIYQSYPGNGKHLIGCYDLKTGKEFWVKDLPNQIVTAPIISKGNLYATTLDGAMTCFDQRDGTIVWQEKKNATSAPVVFNGQVYFSRRDAVKTMDNGKEVVQQYENLAQRDTEKQGLVKDLPNTQQKADYLDIAKREQSSPLQTASKTADAGVGFGGAGGIPGAGPAAGGFNIGQNTVNGVWAYQGSKPFVYNNLLYSSMGDGVKCVDPKTHEVKWSKDLKNPEKKGPVVDANLTPPALVNGKVFMGTSAGQVICMSAKTGETLWTATLDSGISFQPAVVNGMVYVSTNNGGVYAIETGDASDNGWAMWGANAQHNGGID